MAIINVKKDGTGEALTIQQGIQLAQVGDTVQIEAGTFDENVDLWKGITLKGSGIDSTIITGAIRSAITSKTFTWTLGATTLTTVAGNDLSAYEVGRIVTSSGIPANTRIVSKTSTTITISAATTSAATTARAVAMALQNDASMRVRGTNGVIKDMKVIGFDHPNPATEYSAIYFRNTGLGSVPANGWEVFNCEFQANGEYAMLTDYAAGVGNLDIHDCKFTGKTFVGDNPASGNQFSVFNVPRQLVAVQSVNSGLNKFMNNEIVGVTGGFTVTGTPSYNTAVSFDPANSIISGNTVNGTHGYGYALRVRGAGSTVENNTNYSFPNNPNAGYLIGPTGSQVTGMDIGTNVSISSSLVSVEQTAGESFVSFEMSKEILKQNSTVSSHPTFSNEANWNMVSYVFKHDSSARRLVGSFKDFSSPKSSKLKPNMAVGDRFELHKIILATSPRDLLVLKRSQISGASGFDFNLVSDGPEESGGNAVPVIWDTFINDFTIGSNGSISKAGNVSDYGTCPRSSSSLTGDFELTFEALSSEMLNGWAAGVSTSLSNPENGSNQFIFYFESGLNIYTQGSFSISNIPVPSGSNVFKIIRSGSSISFYMNGGNTPLFTTTYSGPLYPEARVGGSISSATVTEP